MTLRQLLLIPQFMFFVPINLLSYILLPKHMRYYNGTFMDYLYDNWLAIKDDWRGI